MAKKPAPGGNLQELKTQLKSKDLGRLYIFHGEEVFLLHHYLEQMKKQLLDALTESFNFHRMNSETFDLQTFADAVENLPMMAEHTMVQVDEVDLFKLGESDRNKIAEILSDIPDYCTVVFTYETTPWKPDKRLKKLWEAIDDAGLIVEFAKQDQKDLAAWVTRHFMARDKRISTDLCLYLIDITGGTMTQGMAAQYRYSISEGVFVYSVEENGAAAKAGLKMGDVITKVDDTTIASMEDLTAVKKKYSAGDTSTLTIYREGKTTTVELTWGTVPKTDTTQAQQSSDQENNSQQGGTTNPYDLFEYFFNQGGQGGSRGNAAG